MGTVLWTGLTVSSSSSQAQSFEVINYQKPFIPMAQLPYRNGPINYVGFPNFGGNRFIENLPIGFSINYFGSSYDRFGVSPNGWIGFIRGTTDSFANVALASAVRPNGFIAPWWDDLNLASLSFGTSYAVFGTTPHRALVIEAANFSASPFRNDGGIWQVWLYETPSGQNTRFEIRVDGDLSNAYSASVGFEGVQGLLGYSFLSCSPNCTASDAQSDLYGKAYTVVNASGPELVGQVDQSPRGVLPGGAAATLVTIKNIGASAAQTVSMKLFASTDNAFDTNDLMLAQTTINALAAGTSAQETLNFTSPPALVSGDYYLLLEVDDNQSVAQSFRLDDHVIASSKFANAYDLQVNSVTSDTSGRPGESFGVQFTVTQEGAPYAGNVNVAVYASADQTFDSSDLQITAPANIALTGSLEQQVMLAATLPSSLLPGQYYVIVLLDTLQQVTEHNEFNNRGSSSDAFDSGPDFAATGIQMPSTITPGGNAQLITTINSLGVSYTGSVQYHLYASADSSLNTQTDYDLGAHQVTFSGQTSVDGTETVTIPSNIAPGAYFVFAVVDPAGQIAETIETNNEFLSLARFLTHTDLSVSNVIAPSEARPGEIINISFDMQALGQPVTNAVDYRIYLSSNPSLGASDISIYDGSTALTNGTLASVQIAVTLPTAILVRQWRILIEADPSNFVIESEEANNVSASLSTMLISGADLVVTPPLLGNPFAFVGREYRLRGDIDNTGVATALDFRYAVYLSDNEVIGTADRRIFLSPLLTLPPGQRHSFDDAILIPADSEIEEQYLGVIADILSVVPETSELNNSLYLVHTVQIVAPSPDLRGNVLGAPSATSSGETISITRVLDNAGVQDANQVRYAYYLSADDLITKDDILLSSHIVSIAQGSNDFGSDSFVIPNGISPGRYYLGGLLDPDETIDETDETNNVFLAPPIQVYAPSIRFVNEQLPRAIIGIPYEVGIFVSGISGVPAISVSQGQLPNGLSIEPSTGYIKGTATNEGLFSFTLKANLSASSFVEEAFTIRAAFPTIGLSIATETVPIILTQKPYRTQLLAVGGIAPYNFTTTSSLPEGLQLSDGGELQGTALITGQYPIDVQVRDDNGDQAAKRLELFVLTPRQTVQIRQSDLPFGIVDVAYCELATVVLRAERGIEPYLWSLDGEPPPGLSLTEDGRLCGTPSTPGEYTIKVRVTDRTGVFDSTAFFIRISSGEAFAVSTFALPFAILDETYESEITAVRGSEPYTFSMTTGKLPPGLDLSTEGLIRGTTTATGTYAFIIQAIDASGRSRHQALSIVVYTRAPAPKDCACSTSRSTPRNDFGSFLFFALLMIALIRRSKPLPIPRPDLTRKDRSP
jgi:subtilase family serine protease